jgi:uncharacterized protein (TIGR02145 family)
MKTKTTFFLLLTITSMMAFGQRPTIELSFSAIDSASYVQLDSIKVMNRTQGGDTVLYFPDTVLMLTFVGINEHPDHPNGLRVMQNFPNPVLDQTTITVYIPEKNRVSLMVTDVLGRKVISIKRVLEQGYHSFRFTPGDHRLYFFSVIWRETRQTIKILSTGNGAEGTCRLEYLVSDDHNVSPLKNVVANTDFLFSIGDTLLYIGYTDTLQSGILDTPETSNDFSFQFATNIPCPETPTVTYEGQVYNTIQIFSQCWLKENLNVGEMIPGDQDQLNNGIIEKYCYNNEPDSCTKYGGLYQWSEMMQYNNSQGAQGICPPGWHIPCEEEWNVLEGAADSQYGMGDDEWEQYGPQGYDAGLHLKSKNSWHAGGNGTDLYSFKGLPAGYRYENWNFYALGVHTFLWTSSMHNYSWSWVRNMDCYDMGMYRDFGHNVDGLSVRCLRDY